MIKKRMNNRYLAWWMMFGLFSAGIVFGQKGPKDTFQFPTLNKVRMPVVRTATLKNGIKLFLVEDHEYPTIDLRAMIRTGSIFEPVEQIGLASITGTVLRTGGSKKYPGDRLDEILETMGASVETSIGEGSGSAAVSLLKDDIVKGLDILADLLRNPEFPKEKLELAKIEYRSAISRRNDNISSITNREFYKLMYGADSPYARHAEYATIDAITQKDLKKFHNHYFHPNNMMIAVWGDFNWKTMKKQIERAFAGWNPGKFSMPPQPEVTVKDRYGVYFIDKPDVNQSNIMIGHIGGLRDNPDYAALIIMNQILSFDRMFKRIRTDEGLAYSVWGSYGANFSYPGVFNAGCQTKSASTVKAIRLMFEEIKKIQETDVTEEELQKARGSFLNGFVFNFDSKAKIVSRMMTYEYFSYPKDFVDRVKEGVEKVSKADVRRVANKYLKPDLVKILVVGNEKELDEPLSVLGEVNHIDVTIPVVREEKPEATTETVAEGEAMMEKALLAAGGSEAVNAIRNMQVSVTLSQISQAGEMAMDAEIVVVYPDKMRAKITSPGGDIILVLNGGDGWIKAPQGTFPMPEAQKQVHQESTMRDPVYYFTHYKTMKVQHLGTRTFGGKDAVDLLLTEGDYSFHLFLDPKTYLVAGQAYTEMGLQGPVKKEEFLTEYKEINGLMISTKSVLTADGKKDAESKVNEMKFNVEIDKEWFEK